ncbi:MAG: hypothetical protein MJ085_01605 [Clostridia bacterium]|nr:hypothetical protein [Clostridia bacterium]
MLSRRPVKETIYKSPSRFFSGALWIPIAAAVALLAGLLTAALITGSGEFIREKSYHVIVRIALIDLLCLVGLYFVIWDGAVRITLSYEGAEARFFGKTLTSFSWEEVQSIYVQHESTRGIEKYLMIVKSDVEPKEQFAAVRKSKRCMSKNPEILLIIPYKVKRSQMLRQFAPDRVKMRYLEKIK